MPVFDVYLSSLASAMLLVIFYAILGYGGWRLARSPLLKIVHIVITIVACLAILLLESPTSDRYIPSGPLGGPLPALRSLAMFVALYLTPLSLHALILTRIRPQHLITRSLKIVSLLVMGLAAVAHLYDMSYAYFVFILAPVHLFLLAATYIASYGFASKK